MDKKENAADSNAAKIQITQADCNKPAGNFNKNSATNLPRLAVAPARIVQDRMVAIMAGRIIGICVDIDIFIDFAGFKILKKFFRKFYAMLCNNKKITRKKLQNLFDRIFNAKKHNTLTRGAVYFAGDIACDLCTEISRFEDIFAQDSCDCRKEF